MRIRCLRNPGSTGADSPDYLHCGPQRSRNPRSSPQTLCLHDSNLSVGRISLSLNWLSLCVLQLCLSCLYSKSLYITSEWHFVLSKYMNNSEMKCSIAAFMCQFSSVCIWPFLDFNSSMQDTEIISFSFFSHYLLDDFRCQALYQNLYTLIYTSQNSWIRCCMKKMAPEKVRVLPNVTQLVGLYHLRLVISFKQLITTVSEQKKDWLKIYWKINIFRGQCWEANRIIERVEAPVLSLCSWENAQCFTQKFPHLFLCVPRPRPVCVPLMDWTKYEKTSVQHFQLLE